MECAASSPNEEEEDEEESSSTSTSDEEEEEEEKKTTPIRGNGETSKKVDRLRSRIRVALAKHRHEWASQLLPL